MRAHPSEGSVHTGHPDVATLPHVKLCLFAEVPVAWYLQYVQMMPEFETSLGVIPMYYLSLHVNLLSL